MASLKDKHIDNAQKFIAKGMYDKAVKEYRALLLLDADIRHRQRLAELLAKSGERDEAVEEYKAISRYYVDNNFLVKAIAVLKQVQKLVPDDVSVTLTLADLNHRQGLTGNSLTEYQAALAYYEKRHNIIDAVEVLKRMLDVDPGNLKIHITLAERRFSIGQQDESFEDFRLVAERVRQQGDDPLYRQITGRMAALFPGRGLEDPLAEIARRLRSGDANGVIAPLMKMAESSPSREVADLLLDASRRAGDAKAFRAACLLAIGQSPDDPGPRRGLLGVTMQQDGVEAAASLLEQWSPELMSASRLPLLHALCREVASSAQGDTHLMQRLASIDPSLTPPTASVDSIPPAAVPEAPAVLPEDGAAAVADAQEDHVWEEDLDLAIASPEDLLADHEELLDLEPMEEEIDGAGEWTSESPLEEAELSPEPLETVDQVVAADFVSVTLGPTELARQDWSIPAGIGSVSFDELTLDDEAAASDMDLHPMPSAAAAGNGDLFSADELLGFGDELLLGDDGAGTEGEASKYGFDGLFSEFKRGVDSAVDSGDTETHFNLGIAYKEMGLLDDAIASFAAATADPGRRIDSIILQGLCYREKGDMGAAEGILRKGVAESDDCSDGAVVLLYELACLLDEKGEKGESLQLFEEVYRLDPLFRDIAGRIAALGGAAPDMDLSDAELIE